MVNLLSLPGQGGLPIAQLSLAFVLRALIGVLSLYAKGQRLAALPRKQIVIFVPV
jgi:hypothetical protein